MNCSIERIHDEKEEAWILSILSEHVKELLILLVAYKYNKIDQINFVDPHNHLALQLCSTIDEKGKMLPIFKSDSGIVIGNWIWFEATVSLLLDVIICGWTDTSHLDFEFVSAQGSTCVNLTVEPPN